MLKIELQPLTLDDCKEVLNLYNNEDVLKFYAKTPILKEEHTPDFFLKITSNGNRTWKIINASDSTRFFGVCSLHDYDKIKESIEIGGTLLPAFWGNNIMLNAFQMLIEKAKINYSIKQIIGKTHSKNKKALRLVEKLNFKIVQSNEHETIVVMDVVR